VCAVDRFLSAVERGQESCSPSAASRLVSKCFPVGVSTWKPAALSETAFFAAAFDSVFAGVYLLVSLAEREKYAST
jgi:hypothetical protein